MTYNITLSIHEAVLKDDKVLGELVRAAVEKRNWELKQANNLSWFGWQELDGTIKVEPYTDEVQHRITDKYEAKEISQYAGEIEATSEEEAIKKTTNIINLCQK